MNFPNKKPRQRRRNSDGALRLGQGAVTLWLLACVTDVGCATDAEEFIADGF